MNLLRADPDPSDPDRVEIEATRTADRLRSLSLARLRTPLADGGPRALRALELAQQLADAAADLAGRSRHRLPEVPDLAVGDVLAVCAADLVEVLRATPEPATVEPVATWASTRLTELRRLL